MKDNQAIRLNLNGMEIDVVEAKDDALALKRNLKSKHVAFDDDKITLEQAEKIGDKLGIVWAENSKEISKKKVCIKQFTRGINVELEHDSKVSPETNITKNNLLATGKIAWAHLKEIPDYYTRLNKMEIGAKKDKDISPTSPKMKQQAYKEIAAGQRKYDLFRNRQKESVTLNDEPDLIILLDKDMPKLFTDWKYYSKRKNGTVVVTDKPHEHIPSLMMRDRYIREYQPKHGKKQGRKSHKLSHADRLLGEDYTSKYDNYDIDNSVENPHWHLQQSAKHLLAAQAAKNNPGKFKFHLGMSKYHSARVREIRGQAQGGTQ